MKITFFFQNKMRINFRAPAKIAVRPHEAVHTLGAKGTGRIAPNFWGIFLFRKPLNLGKEINLNSSWGKLHQTCWSEGCLYKTPWENVGEILRLN